VPFAVLCVQARSDAGASAIISGCGATGAIASGLFRSWCDRPSSHRDYADAGQMLALRVPSQLSSTA